MKKKIFSTALSAMLALSLCPAIALADTGGAEVADAEASIVESVASEEATTDASTDIQVLADAPINTLAATVRSGELGTCTWTLDSVGCLTIAPTNGESGTFEVGSGGSSAWPWENYRSEILTVRIDPGVAPTGSLSYMFSRCTSLTTADLSNFDTSNATSMWGMFYECSSLKIIDASGLDTSNVTSMAYLFEGCTSLTSIEGLQNWDTSSVTDMFTMFYNCTSLTSIDVSGFDTSKVERMTSMFDNCTLLTTLDVSHFDTSNVEQFGDMFYNCSALTSLDVSNFDTSKADDMLGMFYNCSSLTSLDVSGFTAPNATRTSEMFEGCSSLISLNLSQFKASSLEDAHAMFYGCTSLVSLDISSLDLSEIYDAAAMFDGCTSLRMISVGKDFIFDDNFSRIKGDLLDNRSNYLPTPVKDGMEGKWRSSVDGKIYDDPSQLPSNVAATYTAVFPTGKGGYAPIFSDVFTKTSANNWYYDAIYFMASIGIITGYDENTFGVGRSMTRADLVVIIWRYCEPDAYANYNQSTATNTSGLPDVPDKEYYTGAVNWAVGEGIVTGKQLADGSYVFAPSDSVTFDQMVAILARYALGFDAAENYNDSVLHNSKFTDGAIVEDWARGSMSWAINNGVVTGNNNGNGTYTIAPLSNVARERGATVLARSIQSGLVTAK